MTQLDVQLNLDAQINNFSAAYPIDIVYENIDYSPVEGVDYIRVSYINGESSQIYIQKTSPNRTVTILQLNIVTSPGQGKWQAKQIVDAMQPFFKRGLVINNNGIYTRVTSFVLIEPTEETDDYTQIVRVFTRSDYEN